MPLVLVPAIEITLIALLFVFLYMQRAAAQQLVQAIADSLRGIPVLGRLLARGVELRSAALKVAHHGSRSASGAAFLARAGPAVAIVSAATHRADHRGPPHPEVLERLERDGALVLRTGEAGAITLHVTERGLRSFDASGRLLGAWATTDEAVARPWTASP